MIHVSGFGRRVRSKDLWAGQVALRHILPAGEFIVMRIKASDEMDADLVFGPAPNTTVPPRSYPFIRPLDGQDRYISLPGDVRGQPVGLLPLPEQLRPGALAVDEEGTHFICFEAAHTIRYVNLTSFDLSTPNGEALFYPAWQLSLTVGGRDGELVLAEFPLNSSSHIDL